jgi:GNAT superfamily N-acetyltransferase
MSSESASTFVIGALGSQHNRAAFSCGVPALDRYLREQAGQDMRRNVARTFVLVERESSRIAGYYSLAASSVLLTDLPEELAKRLPSYDHIPAVLLGRLAIEQDTRFRGKGLGADLLNRALTHCLSLSRQIGAYAVAVDAIDEQAAAFYRHHQFIPFSEQPLRLFIEMRMIERMHR